MDAMTTKALLFRAFNIGTAVWAVKGKSSGMDSKGRFR